MPTWNPSAEFLLSLNWLRFRHYILCTLPWIRFGRHIPCRNVLPSMWLVHPVSKSLARSGTDSRYSLPWVAKGTACHADELYTHLHWHCGVCDALYNVLLAATRRLSHLVDGSGAIREGSPDKHLCDIRNTGGLAIDVPSRKVAWYFRKPSMLRR